MDKKTVENILANALPRKEFLSEAERRERAPLAFKRRVLGLCGSKVIKPLGEMAETLYEKGLVSNVSEGETLLNFLEGTQIAYAGSNSEPKVLDFGTVEDAQGNQKYRIQAYTQRLLD